MTETVGMGDRERPDFFLGLGPKPNLLWDHVTNLGLE
jgi:hypothetical protein